MIRWVLFDWGNTVMREFPQFSGSMATWPRVEAMPGIGDALRDLRIDYQCALASNAAESGADQAWQALARVGLDALFDVALTARELGASKPDPQFFDALLTRCDALPHQAVMVGDTFRTDIVGAKHASLWAVWYNPAGDPPPAGAHIHPDATLRRLSDLPAAIRAIDLRAESRA
jgi:putative hydrolase of the HAD superfamily